MKLSYYGKFQMCENLKGHFYQSMNDKVDNVELT